MGWGGGRFIQSHCRRKKVHPRKRVHSKSKRSEAEEEEEEEEKEEEEGLFKADAVNEEDPERDRATQV